MAHRLEFVAELVDPDAFRSLLVDYYRDVLPKFAAVSGQHLSAEEMADDALDDSEALLPPRHRLLLVHDDGGRLVGCGCIKRIRDDAGEMKRMYVRPEAQGHGLGRAIFERRIDEARRMGLAWLYADTVRGNRPMLNLYEKSGFEYIDRYPGNSNPPDFAPFLVYLRKPLS